MRVICLEEHAIDADLAKESRAAQMEEAGYMADMTYRDQPGPDDERPHLRDMASSLALARDLAAGRLADMDAHGIDMQVLSYSNASQLVPADRAADLTRVANDRLAEAVRDNPTRFAGFATLPWQRPEAAARELGRAVTELGFKGALITGRPGRPFSMTRATSRSSPNSISFACRCTSIPARRSRRCASLITAASIGKSAHACRCSAGAGTTRRAST